jgi:predicted O-methyltransferase YrrM
VDAQLEALLAELHREGVEHDAAKSDRLERRRNLEPDTASMLALLVRAMRARRVLELGTSNGYSTLWLADAVRDTEGSLLSVDVDAPRQALAAENLARAGLAEVTELRLQDAEQTLRESGGRAWDLIFLDAERPAYPRYWPDLCRVLRAGGLLAVDNVVSHASELVDFRALVHGEQRASEALVPTGAGLLLVLLDATQ